MDSPRPQLPEALPSAELFPAQPGRSRERTSRSQQPAPRGQHSSSGHPSFGSHELRGDVLLCWLELSVSNRSQHRRDGWTAFKSALRRSFVQWNAASTDTQELLYGLRQIGSARSYFPQLRHVCMRSHAIPDSFLFNVVFVNVKPHCRAALTRLQQLRSTDDHPLDKVEESCIPEDEAEFARISSSRAPVFQQNRNRRNSNPRAANGFGLFAVSHACGKSAQRRSVLDALLVVAHVRASALALKAFHSGSAVGSSHQHMDAFSATSKPTPVGSARHVKISSISAASRIQLHVDKLSGARVPSISAQVMKTNSLISRPKQLVFEGTVNRNPITFLLDGGPEHSIMSRASALTNGITMHPLDPSIATTFASNRRPNRQVPLDRDTLPAIKDEPDVDHWEQFFSSFEAAAARWQALPKCRWTEVLRIHCGDSALEVLEISLAHLEVEG
ncbi:hypothetical protein Efla_001292 [Eimeria flavescens]